MKGFDIITINNDTYIIVHKQYLLNKNFEIFESYRLFKNNVYLAYSRYDDSIIMGFNYDEIDSNKSFLTITSVSFVGNNEDSVLITEYICELHESIDDVNFWRYNGRCNTKYMSKEEFEIQSVR